MAVSTNVSPMALPPTSASTLTRISGSRSVVARWVESLFLCMSVSPRVKFTGRCLSDRHHIQRHTRTRRARPLVRQRLSRTASATRTRSRAQTCVEGSATGEGSLAERAVKARGYTRTRIGIVLTDWSIRSRWRREGLKVRAARGISVRLRRSESMSIRASPCDVEYGQASRRDRTSAVVR